MRNCFMKLWRLTSKKYTSSSPKAISCCRNKKSQCFSSKAFRKNSLLLRWVSCFCIIQAFSWWDEAYLHYGVQSTLLSLSTYMSILSKNSLTKESRIVVDQVSGYPCGSVKLPHKINRHKYFLATNLIKY